MFIVRYKNIFLGISAALILLSLVAIFVLGLKPSVEFTGGSIIEVTDSTGELTKEEVGTTVAEVLPEGGVVIQELGESGYIIRTPFLEEAERAEVTSSLTALEGVEIAGESSVGPTIGSELKQKSIIAVVLVAILIVLFVALAFRQVTKPVSSWIYGGVTVTALLHDVLVAAGVFAILGVTVGAEVDSLFIVALLTILGYSVNDSIIIFDRVRENLKMNEDKKSKESFEETVGRSVSETLTRSINTALTTSLALLALYIFGGETTQTFALILLVGVIAGTYSSIFLASPLVIQIAQWQGKTEKKS